MLYHQVYSPRTIPGSHIGTHNMNIWGHDNASQRILTVVQLSSWVSFVFYKFYVLRHPLEFGIFLASYCSRVRDPRQSSSTALSQHSKWVTVRLGVYCMSLVMANDETQQEVLTAKHPLGQGTPQPHWPRLFRSR